MNRTPLRAMSAKRQKAYRDQHGCAPTSTFTRRPQLASGRTTGRPASTGPDQNTVDAVLARDMYSCVRCSTGLHGERGSDWSIHHRKRRAQGGDNSPANLVPLCGGSEAGGCHPWVHANPDAARDAGWLVRGSDDPLTKPVQHAMYGHVYLTDTAGVRTGRPSTRSAR